MTAGAAGAGGDPHAPARVSPGRDAPARVWETTWEGFRALVLENGLVSATVVPEMGGHVASLVDVAAGRELLWRNPRLTPRLAPHGAWFDDWWSGGWDEIFPGGEQSVLRGERLPYMGELWCTPWQASWAEAADGTEASVTATVAGNVAAARFSRRLALRAGQPVLWASYRIESLDVLPIPFTWGVHPALAVGEGDRIDLPANEGMLVGVASGPSMGAPGQAYAWPTLPTGAPGGERDMSLVRGREAGVFGGHWATGLSDGWLALTDTAARRGLAIVFDREVFPHAWLWQVYGGWRGHHLLCLEPWTSHPQDIEGAAAAGRARVLAPGGRLETWVAFALHEGLERVSGVERGPGGLTVR